MESAVLGTIVVAGATGALGREVVRALRDRGNRVRALVRDVARARTLELDEVHAADALDPGSLIGAFDGATHAFSSVGASVSSQPGAGRASFLGVDVPAHRNLIAAARRAGVRRFVYVSAHTAPEKRDVAYFRAHAEVEDLLRSSGMRWGIARPTGLFTAFCEYLRLAAKGAVPELGSGTTRTNPIHPADVAEVCADLLQRDRDEARDVGGPEVLTRHQIVELAFEAVGRPVRVRRIPTAVARVASALAHPFHPRLAEIGQFLAAIHEMDVVAPPFGRRTLAAYFRERVRALD
jgi:uncharacterized protein YbjT (DUF2867 family)